MTINYKDIVWEDDELEAQKSSEKEEDNTDFAKWLEEDHSLEGDNIRVGTQIEGTLLSVSEDSNDAIIEITGRSTGVMDKQELMDPETGNLKFQVGERVRAYVVSRRESEVILSTSLSNTRQSENDLYAAYKNQVPVKGRVVKENSGGFDVMIFGKRAFCPVSQIDRGFVTNKTEYVNKEFNFLIEKLEGGRNIVLSRTKLLDKEAELKIEELRQRLDQEVVLDGVVKEVKDFGAFIDLGGYEGFVHVSEMSYSRVAKAFDFLHRGEKVRAKVLGIEEKNGKTRISLSIKAAANDPWNEMGERFHAGQNYLGKVVRLENFGAFVELEPGLEGLIHVSEMSWGKRVMHPKDVVNVGDQVNVRILQFDRSMRKISLSLKDIDKDPWLDAEKKYPKDTIVTGKVISLKDFGAIIELDDGLTGLVPISTLRQAYGEAYRKKCSPPQTNSFKIVKLDKNEKRILLAPPDINMDDEDLANYRQYIQEMSQKEEATKTRPSQQGTFGALLAAKLKEKG